jgi:hypothetical protein
MGELMTPSDFIEWLAKESDNLAQATSNGGDPFPYLWLIATDALDWLRQAPLDVRENVLRAVRQFLDTGSFGETVTSADNHEASCFRTLLGWIINPPLVL